MDSKKKIAIVSSDDILIYQPTILNLYDLLSESFDVTIITFLPEYLGKKKETQRRVFYIQSPFLKSKIFRLTDLLINAVAKRIDKYLFSFKYLSAKKRSYREKLLRKTIRTSDADIFIAADTMPLYAVQHEKGAAHFLSLEIIPEDKYMKKINPDLILSVIIQNKYRYDYLFPEGNVKPFYLQNAPFFKDKAVYEGKKEGLVWAGTVVKEFGITSCFEFIKAHPEYRLTCKGAVEKKTAAMISRDYSDLISSGKVVMNDQYLSSDQFIQFISRFRIGFCFYDWDLIRKNFNYATAPSGKLFVYLAAGVPVIASNIPGFAFIREQKAGVLVDDYSVESIYNAILEIEKSYDTYAANAYKVFEENCFDRNADAFVDFLKYSD